MFKKILYVILVLCLLYFAFHKLFIFAPGRLERIASAFLSPFLSIQKKVTDSLDQWQKDRKLNSELKNELEVFRSINENLQAELIALKAGDQYLQNIKLLMDFSKRYKSDKAILTQIILKNFDDGNHFYIIDSGSDHGIEIDMAVVYKNCLIGRVIDAYPYFSKVMLITDKKCKVSSECSKNSYKAIHVGTNSLENSELLFVNNLETVNIDDLVLSNGEGLIFPRGFALGTIKSCKIDGFSYFISVKPLIDFQSLTYCYVIQKGAQLVETDELKEVANSKEHNAEQEARKMDVSKKEELKNVTIKEQENAISSSTDIQKIQAQSVNSDALVAIESQIEPDKSKEIIKSPESVEH